jgi:flagellar motor component MotA
LPFRFYALAERDLPSDANKITDAAIIAGALVGTLNGVIGAWVLQWPNKPMTDLMEHSLKRMLPITDLSSRSTCYLMALIDSISRAGRNLDNEHRANVQLQKPSDSNKHT